MATKARRNGKPKAQPSDSRLESNQRMVWIEQGGIDLREARSKARVAARPRGKS